MNITQEFHEVNQCSETAAIPTEIADEMPPRSYPLQQQHLSRTYLNIKIWFKMRRHQPSFNPRAYGGILRG